MRRYVKMTKQKHINIFYTRGKIFCNIFAMVQYLSFGYNPTLSDNRPNTIEL